MVNDLPQSDQEPHRSLGQSILYWTIVYLITIPATFIVVGFIVRFTLSTFS